MTYVLTQSLLTIRLLLLPLRPLHLLDPHYSQRPSPFSFPILPWPYPFLPGIRSSSLEKTPALVRA